MQEIAMQEKVNEILSHIQERCLWQFHSRTWDREQNINGVLNDVAKMLTGEAVVAETPMEKSFYADAKILVEQIKEKFSWINEMGDSEKKEIIEAIKAKLIDITVTKSLNGELNVPFY